MKLQYSQFFTHFGSTLSYNKIALYFLPDFRQRRTGFDSLADSDSLEQNLLFPCDWQFSTYVLEAPLSHHLLYYLKKKISKLKEQLGFDQTTLCHSCQQSWQVQWSWRSLPVLCSSVPSRYTDCRVALVRVSVLKMNTKSWSFFP